MAGRIDLAAVEASLRDLQAGFPWLNEGLESPRDRLDDEVILNLLAGYAYIDRAVAAGIDFLALGNLKHLLELNTIVLCGEEPSARRLNARHIAATERHFWTRAAAGCATSSSGMTGTATKRSGSGPQASTSASSASRSSTSRAITAPARSS